MLRNCLYAPLLCSTNDIINIVGQRYLERYALNNIRRAGGATTHPSATVTVTVVSDQQQKTDLLSPGAVNAISWQFYGTVNAMGGQPCLFGAPCMAACMSTTVKNNAPQT